MAFLERGKWVAFAAMSNKRNTTTPWQHTNPYVLCLYLFLLMKIRQVFKIKKKKSLRP